MSSSSTFQTLSKRVNLDLTSGEHYLISCVYIAEVNSGGIPPSKQTSVVNLRSNNVLSDISNSSISFSPPAIQYALAPTKASLLCNSGYLKCLNCDGEATHVCSSVAVSTEKYKILIVSERLICSCDGDTCISEARRRRNQTSLKKDELGDGFNFAFRCALKPISRVLECLPRAKG